MHKSPTLYTLPRLTAALNSGVQSSDGSGAWVPARPMGYYSLRRRVRFAWMVFTGKADAFVWPQGQ